MSTRECKIVCVKSNCADLFYAPYWGKQLAMSQQTVDK